MYGLFTYIKSKMATFKGKWLGKYSLYMEHLGNIFMTTMETNEQWPKPSLFRVYRGLYKLPSYIGIIMNHYNDPYQPTMI